MNKLIIPVLLAIINVNIQAQSNVSVLQLMEANNGADIYAKLIESALPNIETGKQADFKQKALKLAEMSKSEAIAYFEKKYNQEDLKEIYTEISQPDRVSYSEKTTWFLKEWRGFKTGFQSKFKLLYNSYQ